MKIQTIYNIGEEVWVMSNNVPVKSKITGHYFDNNFGKEKKPVNELLGWELEGQELLYSMATNIKRMETEMFRTKEELLNWLSNLAEKNP